ncbi:MAG: hypothetical protein JST87_06425 [Bacteroidetes bacterium]|nr:hypothetical protein [Bacteroidota bacterium]
MKLINKISAKSKALHAVVCICVGLSMILQSDFLVAQINYNNLFVKTVSFVKGTNSGSFDLVSFDAEQTDNSKVVLKWATAAEKNASHFVLQRSENGKSFYDAVVLFADEGNRNTKTNYRFADLTNISAKTGTVYYRLKMVNQKGKYTYSQPLVIHIKMVEEQMRSL